MAVGERDPYTGHMTTGHEWNGITELNRPVPKVIWFFLAVTVVYSIVYWILMPAWPLGVTYTKGILGIDQRTTVAQRLEAAAEERAAWTQRMIASDFDEIRADAGLMAIVDRTGGALYGDNCAVCHGVEGRGARGYPSLVDHSWLWGGDAETVYETLRVGINSGHPETRTSMMMAFGRDGILDRRAVLDVTSYVQSLSAGANAGLDEDRVAAGAEVYQANCAACHGQDGTGRAEMGAPDLTNNVWIYGGNRQSIYDSIFSGRQGHMPHWEGRLGEVDLKILTLYVQDLEAGNE